MQVDWLAPHTSLLSSSSEETPSSIYSFCFLQPLRFPPHLLCVFYLFIFHPSLPLFLFFVRKPSVCVSLSGFYLWADSQIDGCLDEHRDSGQRVKNTPGLNINQALRYTNRHMELSEQLYEKFVYFIVLEETYLRIQVKMSWSRNAQTQQPL